MSHPSQGAERSKSRQRGFTLIEIMVVVVIIGLLAAVIVPTLMGTVDQARTSKPRQATQAIETALTMFRLDNARYPSPDQGLKALVQQPTDPSIRNWRPGGYVKKASRDPWGNDYQYVYPGTHGVENDPYSLGLHAQAGGEGPRARVGAS